MITEDHVSFETAKLLKEKGFNEPCIWLYSKKGEKHYASYYHSPWPNNDLAADEWACCTQAMAMKWLREVHKIHITIYYSAFLYGKHPYYWSIDKIDTIPKANAQIEISTNTHDYSFVYYETACESAIKYCLENLI